MQIVQIEHNANNTFDIVDYSKVVAVERIFH